MYSLYSVHLCVCCEMRGEVGEAERCEDAVCTVYSVHLCVRCEMRGKVGEVVSF